MISAFINSAASAVQRWQTRHLTCHDLYPHVRALSCAFLMVEGLPHELIVDILAFMNHLHLAEQVRNALCHGWLWHPERSEWTGHGNILRVNEGDPVVTVSGRRYPVPTLLTYASMRRYGKFECLICNRETTMHCTYYRELFCSWECRAVFHACAQNLACAQGPAGAREWHVTHHDTQQERQRWRSEEIMNWLRQLKDT